MSIAHFAPLLSCLLSSIEFVVDSFQMPILVFTFAARAAMLLLLKSCFFSLFNGKAIKSMNVPRSSAQKLRVATKIKFGEIGNEIKNKIIDPCKIQVCTKISHSSSNIGGRKEKKTSTNLDQNLGGRHLWILVCFN